MKFEVSKRQILKPTLSIDMVQWVLWWERQKSCSSIKKRQGPMVEKCFYKFFLEEKNKTREDKRMVKLDFFSKPNTLKKLAHLFFRAWSFLSCK